LLPRWQSRLRWFSGADRGPCDAVHRGFAQATGEVFAWLNADDRYLLGAIGAAVRYLEAHPEIDVVYGNARWIDENGTVLGAYPTLPFASRVLARDCFICQPAAFLRASSYSVCSLDPSVVRSFDYDLWIRMDKQHMRFAHLPEFLAESRMHSGAKT